MKHASAVATIVAVKTAPKSKKPFSGPANSPDNINGFKYMMYAILKKEDQIIDNSIFGNGVYLANLNSDKQVVICGFRNELESFKEKLFGLTIAPERLRQIRKERRSIGSYSSIKQISYEVRQAERIFKKNNIKFIDTPELSIEEIS